MLRPPGSALVLFSPEEIGAIRLDLRCASPEAPTPSERCEKNRILPTVIDYVNYTLSFVFDFDLKLFDDGVRWTFEEDPTQRNIFVYSRLLKCFDDSVVGYARSTTVIPGSCND